MTDPNELETMLRQEWMPNGEDMEAPPQGEDSARLVGQVFDYIERHQAPLTSRAARGISYLRILDEGQGELERLADLALEYRLRMGGHAPFLEALEKLSLYRMQRAAQGGGRRGRKNR